MSPRRTLTLTVCVRDHDAKTFDFLWTGDTTAITHLVTMALSRGRRVRCYLLAADPDGRIREERYLVAKGYLHGQVDL
jgi:hypothetical protein